MTDTNYNFEVGKWYKTRKGLDAKILDADLNGPNGAKIAGKVKHKDGVEFVRSWHSNGRWLESEDTEYDLMPPVETKELWVNVYPEPKLCEYKSKSLADEYACIGRIGQMKITVTGDKYEVEKVEI